MSDTQDEPFDKEAEKEKLRQQLADEEEARQATQHMSELLLKGATMTNRHCDECGDPLFRHEGREFCPSCGRQRAGDGAAAAETEAEAGSTAESVGDEPAAPSEAPTEPAAGPTPTEGQPGAPDRSQAAGAQYAGEADLPDARAALARKVTALAKEAEATNDVGRARELLGAVREGAEALRALERQGR